MYKSLHVARGIASLLVVLFHATGTITLEKYFGESANFLNSAFFPGQPRQAFFFVLSGYLIDHVHSKVLGQPTRLKRFIGRRITRIYPLYWIVFLCVYLTAAILLPEISIALPPVELVKSRLLTPVEPGLMWATGAPVLIVAWTLQYEMLFYSAYALCIYKKQMQFGILIVWLSLVLLRVLGYDLGYLVEFATSQWTILFLIGVLFSRFRIQIKKIFKRVALHILMGVSFLATLVYHNIYSNSPILDIHVAYGLCSGLIILSLIEFEERAGTLSPPPILLLLGSASYSLYLIHFPLLSLLNKLFSPYFPKTPLGVMTAFILMVVMCCAVAIFLYRLVEAPMRKHMSARLATVVG